jgi:8-oxo-dGTP pyrophosphatase MutT (NUDIX family)
MRQSVAALALIRRLGPSGEVEWLTNWNDKWAALNLVGGHQRPGESFRQCCAREVTEELGLTEDVDFQVASAPAAHLEYTAESKSSGTATAYTMELFAVELLTAAARARVAADPATAWVTGQEIRAGRAADGRAVSATVLHLLTRAGLLAG